MPPRKLPVLLDNYHQPFENVCRNAPSGIQAELRELLRKLERPGSIQRGRNLGIPVDRISVCQLLQAGRVDFNSFFILCAQSLAASYLAEFTPVLANLLGRRMRKNEERKKSLSELALTIRRRLPPNLPMDEAIKQDERLNAEIRKSLKSIRKSATMIDIKLDRFIGQNEEVPLESRTTLQAYWAYLQRMDRQIPVSRRQIMKALSLGLKPSDIRDNSRNQFIAALSGVRYRREIVQLLMTTIFGLRSPHDARYHDKAAVRSRKPKPKESQARRQYRTVTSIPIPTTAKDRIREIEERDE